MTKYRAVTVVILNVVKNLVNRNRFAIPMIANVVLFR